jgi:hypothetical protein
MSDTVLCQRYGTTSGIKQMGTHNKSENGRVSWVALCAHPTHTETGTDTFSRTVKVITD